jgi:hypothetical protein
LHDQFIDLLLLSGQRLFKGALRFPRRGFDRFQDQGLSRRELLQKLSSTRMPSHVARVAEEAATRSHDGARRDGLVLGKHPLQNAAKFIDAVSHRNLWEVRWR